MAHPKGFAPDGTPLCIWGQRMSRTGIDYTRKCTRNACKRLCQRADQMTFDCPYLDNQSHKRNTGRMVIYKNGEFFADNDTLVGWPYFMGGSDSGTYPPRPRSIRGRGDADDGRGAARGRAGPRFDPRTADRGNGRRAGRGSSRESGRRTTRPSSP